LVNSSGVVIVDSLKPTQLKGSALPKGAWVVLRGGGGEVATGLIGYFPQGSKVATEVTMRVINGKRGGDKNLSFEGQGNGFAVLGKASQDEFVPYDSQVRFWSTVTGAADMMKLQVCK